MNYLGHAFFSTSDTFLGNMAGDSMKGVQISTLSENVVRGLQLHHLIDKVTDSHPLFGSAVSLFSSQKLRYAGVLTDIAIDYALASSWNTYSSLDWDLFKEDVYQRLLDERYTIPGSFRYSAYWLVSEDWFESYRSIDGMQTAYYRLSRKTRRPVDPAAAALVIQQNKKFLSEFARDLIEGLITQPRIASTFSELLSRPCFSPPRD